MMGDIFYIFGLLVLILNFSILKNKKGEKIHKADNSIKSFIQNKMTNYLTNSDLTEKLLLYNLISKNNNVNTDEGCKINNDDFIKSFSKIFDQDTIEKYFQKEVIRFTIENFCNFLKNNGYTIIKNNEDIEGSSDEERGNRKNKEIICPHTDRKHYAKVVLINIEYV